MEQIEIKFGGKPTLVQIAPSYNYPEVPHKVVTVVDMESGQLYMPGPEMLTIEGFYQAKLDFELWKKAKR